MAEQIEMLLNGFRGKSFVNCNGLDGQYVVSVRFASSSAGSKAMEARRPIQAGCPFKQSYLARHICVQGKEGKPNEGKGSL